MDYGWRNLPARLASSNPWVAMRARWRLRSASADPEALWRAALDLSRDDRGRVMRLLLRRFPTLPESRLDWAWTLWMDTWSSELGLLLDRSCQLPRDWRERYHRTTRWGVTIEELAEAATDADMPRQLVDKVRQQCRDRDIALDTDSDERLLRLAVNPDLQRRLRRRAVALYRQRGLSPQTIPDQILFLMSEDSLEQYRAFDPDGSMLRLAIEQAEPDARRALLTELTARGEGDLVASLVGDTADTLAPQDHRALVDAAVRSRAWPQLWRLVLRESLRGAVDLAARITGWEPGDEGERALFHRLRSCPADRWTFDWRESRTEQTFPMPGYVKQVSVDPDGDRAAVLVHRRKTDYDHGRPLEQDIVYFDVVREWVGDGIVPPAGWVVASRPHTLLQLPGATLAIMCEGPGHFKLNKKPAERAHWMMRFRRGAWEEMCAADHKSGLLRLDGAYCLLFGTRIVVGDDNGDVRGEFDLFDPTFRPPHGRDVRVFVEPRDGLIGASAGTRLSILEASTGRRLVDTDMPADRFSERGSSELITGGQLRHFRKGRSTRWNIDLKAGGLTEYPHRSQSTGHTNEQAVTRSRDSIPYALDAVGFRARVNETTINPPYELTGASAFPEFEPKIVKAFTPERDKCLWTVERERDRVLGITRIDSQSQRLASSMLARLTKTPLPQLTVHDYMELSTLDPAPRHRPLAEALASYLDRRFGHEIALGGPTGTVAGPTDFQLGGD